MLRNTPNFPLLPIPPPLLSLAIVVVAATTIDLIKDEARGESLHPNLLMDGMGLDVDTLDNVNEDEGIVIKAGCDGDLATKAYVAREVVLHGDNAVPYREGREGEVTV